MNEFAIKFGIKKSLHRFSKFLPVSLNRLGRKTYLRNRAIEPEILKLKEWCPDDRIAIDIGANRGDYSLFLASYATHVHCFEPNPSLANELKRFLSGLPVTVHQVGLGEEPGKFELHIPYVGDVELHGWASFNNFFSKKAWKGSQITSVKTSTVNVKKLDDIDDLFDVGFIKIDVEGHEFSVLKGAENLIRRDLPNLLIEIEQRHLNFPIQLIFDWLIEIGYSGVFIDDGIERPLSEFNLDIHQSDPDISEYKNNFFFKS